MSTYCGIDFGTTNSAISINTGGKVSVLEVDRDESGRPLKVLRSALYFDQQRQVTIGQGAVRKHIEAGATGRFMRSIKSFLPTSTFTTTEIWGKAYSIEDLVALIIRNLKEKAEKYAGQQIETVVLGRPVIFSTDSAEDALAEGRLREAAVLAGFKKIIFQLEPVAAAISFQRTLTSSEERLVLICDLGGGTSDFSLIRLKGEQENRTDRKNAVLSVQGLDIGGDTLDSMVVWEKVAHFFGRGVKCRTGNGEWLPLPPFISHKLRHWHLLSQLRDRAIRAYLKEQKNRSDNPEAITNLENLIEENRLFEIFRQVEEMKCTLTTTNQAAFNFESGDLDLHLTLARAEFEKIIDPAATQIEWGVMETIRKAGLKPSDVDLVFTTGGTSLVPAIRNRLENIFGAHKLRSNDSFTSVVFGLGSTYIS